MKFILLLALFIAVTLGQSSCVQPAIPFQLRRTFTYYPSEESWKIFEGTDDTGTLIHSADGTGFSNFDIHDWEVCMELNKQYVLYLYDSYGDGWGYSAYPSMVYIRFMDTEFLSGTLAYGSAGPAIYPFTLSLPIQPFSTFKTTTTAQIGTTWTQYSFGDTAWTTGSANSFPAISTTTRYYRYTTTVSVTNSYAISFKVKSNSGLVFYVNGQEVYRVFLPTTSDSTTVSTTAEEQETWKSITIPTSLYVTSTALCIAVEVHAATSQIGSTDPFDLIGTFYSDSEGTRVGNSGTGVCVPENSAYTEDCENLFDTNLASKYLAPTTSLPITITYTLPNNGQTWMNAYQIGSANDVPTRDPSGWKLYGANDDTTWYLIDTVARSSSFASRKTLYTYYVPSNRKLYNKFKFEILGDFGAGYFQSSEIRFLAVNKAILAAGIQYESTTLSFLTDVTFTTSPISTGLYSFSITPSLPTGVYINADTGAIYGTSTTDNTGTYTITATDGSTLLTTSTILSITFSSCSQPSMASLYIRKTNTSKSSAEHISIYSSNNVSLFTADGDGTGAEQTWNICLVSGRVSVELTQDNNNGWAEGTYMEISLRYSSETTFRIARLWLLSGSTTTYYVNTRLDLPYKSAWTYYPALTAFDSTWHGISYAETGWTQLTTPSSVSVTPKIILLRKTFTLLSKTNMMGWELSFKAKAGTVVYINNQEVYRYYLPAGEISLATTATGGSASFFWTSISGPMSTLNNNLSVTVAIALVQLDTTEYTLDFDAYFHLLGDKNVDIGRDGDYTCDGSLFGDGYAGGAFDSKTSSRWITGVHDSISARWVAVMFTNHRAAFANRYCVVNSWDSPQHDPVDWTIYGSADGSTWTSLTSQTGISWEERKQRQCFYMASVNQGYFGYKLEVTKAAQILSENKYALTEFELYTEDLDSVVIPAFSFTPSIISAYKGIDFPALLVSSEYYTDFSITPSLPTPLLLDSSNGYITGVPTTLMSATSYTISATSIKGVAVATTVTISVIQCTSPNNLFSLTLVFSGGAIEASWTLNDPNGSLIDTRTQSISYATQVFSFCKPVGVYTLILGDSENDGWGAGTFAVSYEDSTAITSGTVSTGESPKTIQFTVGKILISDTITYKYLVDGSTASSNWYATSFSDASWSSATSTSLPVVSSNTQYYRTSFTAPSITSSILGLDISVKTYAGLVVYMNGIEIRRLNLPSGTLTSSTLATSEYSDYTTITTSFLFTEIPLSTTNVIAVEIHKFNTIPETNGFAISATFIGDNDYLILDGVASSDIDKTDSEGYAMVFDNNVYTKTLSGPRCTGAFFQWTYNNNRKVVANKYIVANANDCNQRHPSGWRIEGSNDGSTWTLLDYQQAQMFTAFYQKKTYNIVNNVAYNSYRMYVTECQNTALDSLSCGDGNVQLSEFQLYVTSYASTNCAATDGYTGSVDGAYSVLDCGSNYSGIKRRLCTNGVLGEVQNLCIADPPTIFSYAGSPFTFYKKISASVIPTVNGNDLTITVTPTLPTGLLLNSVTGAITGTPTVETTLGSYNLTATNTGGSITTVILIKVDTARCAADGLWPITEIGTTATRSCTDSTYTGSITRYCQLSYPAVWGTESNSCVLIPPTVSYTTSSYNGYTTEFLSLIPTVTGGSITGYSISPALPTGLTFSSANGQISGTPTTVSTGQYTITVTNAGGSGTASLAISIANVYCGVDGSWPSTIRGTTAYIACATGQSGVQTRVCSNAGSGMASWQTADSSSCFTYLSTENPGDNKVFLLVPILITGVSKTTWDTSYSSQEIFRQLLVHSLSTYSIASSAVQILSSSSSTVASGDAVLLSVRILCNDADKTSISNTISTYISNSSTSGLLYGCTSSGDSVLATVTAVSLSGSIETKTNSLSGGVIALIVILVILVVVVAGVLIFCFYVRTKSKGKNSKNGKKLGSKPAAKKEVKSAKAVKV